MNFGNFYNINLMNLTKITIITLFSIVLTRIIPHPPNFTSLIAISFYIPLIFGTIYMPIVLFSFVITDIFIGFHNVLFFTWGSVVIIGLLSKYFASLGFKFRIFGVLSGAVLFFIVTNFGFWLLSGLYDHNLTGLINCYTLAIPFFGYTLLSTITYSIIIEVIYKYKNLFFFLKRI